MLSIGFLGGEATATAPIPVSITSSAITADAGFPFELTAVVRGPAAFYYYNWTDNLGDANTGPSWEVTVGAAGNLSVTLRVRDDAGEFGAATLTVPVRPPLSLAVGSPLTRVDAGVPAPFYIDVAGGVSPITAFWNSLGGGTNGSASWSADGNYSEVASFPNPGPGWILVSVVDVLGDSSSTRALVTQVVPPASLYLATNGSVGEAGWPLGIAVVVERGAPPFQWSFSTSLPTIGGDVSSGSFPTDGLYQWSLPFAWAGTATLNLTVIDAVGAVATATAGVSIEPSLEVSLTSPGWTAATSLEVGANISGGLAPYTYQFRFSDGEVYSGTLNSPRSIAQSFGSRSSGNYSIELRVTDALGQTRTVNESLPIDGGPPSVSSTPSLSGSAIEGVAAIVVAGLIAALYFYHRLRRSPDIPAVARKSALPTVRQLMKRSQTIDRETLLILGEEAGEPVDAVQSALRVLIQNGEVTVEPGPVDDEVLHWKGSDRPNGTSGGSP